MACPYFDPQNPLEPEVSRASLGVAHHGRCTLNPALPATRETLVELCNAGYARGRCAAFSAASTKVDAVRFSWSSGRILWIEESAHRPLRFGEGVDAPDLPAHIVRLAAAFARAVAPGNVHRR